MSPARARTSFTSWTVGGKPPDWSLIPPHMHVTVRDYVESGILDDEFFTAVVSNDLKRSCETADSVNRNRLFDYCSFLFMYAPNECWGSPKKVQEWRMSGGLAGRRSR